MLDTRQNLSHIITCDQKEERFISVRGERLSKMCGVSMCMFFSSPKRHKHSREQGE